MNNLIEITRKKKKNLKRLREVDETLPEVARFYWDDVIPFVTRAVEYAGANVMSGRCVDAMIIPENVVVMDGLCSYLEARFEDFCRNENVTLKFRVEPLREHNTLICDIQL